MGQRLARGHQWRAARPSGARQHRLERALPLPGWRGLVLRSRGAARGGRGHLWMERNRCGATSGLAGGQRSRGGRRGHCSGPPAHGRGLPCPWRRRGQGRRAEVEWLFLTCTLGGDCSCSRHLLFHLQQKGGRPTAGHGGLRAAAERAAAGAAAHRRRGRVPGPGGSSSEGGWREGIRRQQADGAAQRHGLPRAAHAGSGGSPTVCVCGWDWRRQGHRDCSRRAPPVWRAAGGRDGARVLRRPVRHDPRREGSRSGAPPGGGGALPRPGAPRRPRRTVRPRWFPPGSGAVKASVRHAVCAVALRIRLTFQ
mmetsp:Transcript_29844/g.80211  ORF Transcript_29844/g.80211 Transcript_29844/m.80211 type:complete len:310 (+) Transcript_29844:714-1643(+)